MRILSKIQKFQENFFKIDDKIITTKTKIIYFLYILVLIFMLSSFLTKQENSIKNPSLLYPKQCRILLKKQKISIENLLKNSYRANKIYQSETCFQILNNLELFQKNEKDNLEKLAFLQREKSQFKEEIQDLLQAYPTILQEKMANVAISSSILDINYENAKQRRTYLDERIQKLEEQEGNLSKQIMDKIQAQELDKMLLNKQDILEKFSRANFYYPLKIFLYSFFWLTIFALLSKILQNKFNKKGSFLIAKLFSYNINISALFLLYFFLKFLRLILPKFFLAKIIAFLTEYNLLFIFQYFAIFALIFLFIILIKFFQNKKVHNYEKEDKERIFRIISQNLCFKCFLKSEGDFCRFCGEQSFKFCPKCQNKSGASDIFCNKCGEKF